MLDPMQSKRQSVNNPLMPPLHKSLDSSLEGYSLEMEILCCIPDAPSWVPAWDLAQDFGVTTARMKEMLGYLSKEYSVSCGEDSHVSIPKRNHGKSHKTAMDYWERVYEPDSLRASVEEQA